MKTPLIAFALLVPLTIQAQQAAPPLWPVLQSAADRNPLPNTAALDWEGDLAAKMVDGVDRFLLRKIDEAAVRRAGKMGTRQQFADMLGVKTDARVKPTGFEYLSEAAGSVREVRWQALEGVSGVGLLFQPKDGTPQADIILVPDADAAGSGDVLRAAQKLSAHARVLVLRLIDRRENQYKMSDREWLHRPAYELGATLAGYEVQKILAAVDLFTTPERKIGVAGWGEGGRLALYAGALDDRITTVASSGYFADRQKVWDEPADRQVFGLLNHFGDAELLGLLKGPFTIEPGPYPQYIFRGDAYGSTERLATRSGKNGKPGKLIIPTQAELDREFKRSVSPAGEIHFPLQRDRAFADTTLRAFLEDLGLKDAALAEPKEPAPALLDHQAGQVAEIVRYNQIALINAAQVRAEYFADLKTDSMAMFKATVEPYRRKFRTDVIGAFDDKRLPLNPRSRKFQEGPKTVSYEVVLDVFPDVFAYGILTLPKDFNTTSGDRRPVVVCQHGLEGRPQDVVGEAGYGPYKAFATRLAERGFITFAPQNIYIGQDRFRTLQFKAQSIGRTLFSVIVPSHQQITDWLAAQSFVDPDRIAFYGLSYGGKSAMRIPPLVDRYCLSICSADFNEWVWKNAATDAKSLRYSYANKGEYEIFEFNLGGTFNYAEMAALICPRPFMVERGHFDGVGPDEAVAYEFAKVENLYAARLGIGELSEIEWFAGPHAINEKGTYAFLHKHLRWPEPK